MEMRAHEWQQAVTLAFRESGSTLALSRSPLAGGPLIAAALVLDDVAPTPDERGLALRLALQWATEQLAPKKVRYGFGEERPAGDRAWRDPRAWHYTLLRHRWLEPLSDAECAGQGGMVAALQARTGIATAAQLADEQTRALQAAAAWLQRQQHEGIGNGRLRELALAAVLAPLRSERRAVELLSLAALFGGLFARAALLELAAAEGLPDPAPALDLLLARRCLQAGDGGTRLWMSPVLRAYVREVQPHDRLTQRALAAAAQAEAAGDAGNAAPLLLLGGQAHRAAARFLAIDDEARAGLEGDAAPLLNALLQPQALAQLAPDQARTLFLLRAGQREAQGDTEGAVDDCRDALHASATAVEQALVYARLAALLADQNEEQALTCYNLALERLPADHAQTPVLLKDRAWLLLARREWRAAHDDLQRALDWQAAGATHAPSAAAELAGDLPADLSGEAAALRADILDAMSHLQRVQGNAQAALTSAHAALALREQAGDPLRVARCYNNLGILYRTTGEFGRAIGAYRQAQAIFARMGQPLLEATALLNIAATHALSGDVGEAEASNLQSLTLAEERLLPLAAVRARAGLVELLAEQGRDDEAAQQWRAAFAAAAAWGLDDELDFLRRIAQRVPGLAALAAREAPSANEAADAPELALPAGVALDADEAAALVALRRDGRVTVAALMQQRPMSKATATRKLGRLAAAGILQRHGSGRGTFYVAAGAPPAPQPGAPVAAADGQARLDALTPRFSTSHTVERLTLGAVQPALEVQVSFRRPPELEAFLALQAALGDAMRARVVLHLA